MLDSLTFGRFSYESSSVSKRPQRVAALRRDARACGGAADDAFGTFVVEEACAQG